MSPEDATHKSVSKYRTKNKKFIGLPLHTDVLEIIDLLAAKLLKSHILTAFKKFLTRF